MSASSAQVLRAVQGLDIDESRAVIAGGAALAFLNPTYVPTDVDVFVFGPDAVQTAFQIVRNAVCLATDFVVAARSSVITIWRPELLPLQIVVSSATSAKDVVNAFDLNICKVVLDLRSAACAVVTPLDATCNYGPGGDISIHRDADCPRTRRRVIKYVLAGYTMRTAHILPHEVREVQAIQSRTPKWFPGMTASDMAAHVVYLGGFQHVWCPNETNDVDVELRALFARAQVSATTFGADTCGYIADTVSPATIRPPYQVHAKEQRLELALRTLLRMFKS